MVLDVIAASVVLWGIVRGGLRGFLFQLGQVGLLALAFVAARALGDLVTPWVQDLLDVSPLAREILAFFLVFLVVFAIGSLLLRAFTRDLHEASKTLSAGDRVLGAVVGGVKGAVFVYLVLVGLIMANQLTGSVPIPYASSASGRWVMKHNLFETEAFPRARALAKLGWLLHTRGAEELLRNEHVQAILEHPKAAVLRTPDVVDALVRGDWVDVVSNEALWDLLDEPEVQGHLNAIEWEVDAPPDPARAPGAAETPEAPPGVTGEAPAPGPPPPPSAHPPGGAPPSPPAPSPPSSSHRPRGGQASP